MKEDKSLFCTNDRAIEFINQMGIYYDQLISRIRFIDTDTDSKSSLYINPQSKKINKNKQITLMSYTPESIRKFRQGLSLLLYNQSGFSRLILIINLLRPVPKEQSLLFLFIITVFDEVKYFLFSNPEVEVNFAIDKCDDDFLYNFLIIMRERLKNSSSFHPGRYELLHSFTQNLYKNTTPDTYKMHYLGDYWIIYFKEKSFIIKDTLGMKALAYLLKNPGQKIQSSELAILIRGPEEKKDEQIDSYLNTRANFNTVIGKLKKIRGSQSLREYFDDSFKTENDNDVYCTLNDDKRWEVILPKYMLDS